MDNNKPEPRATESLTLDELRSRPTVTVPQAGMVLGLGKDAAYECARRGEIPTIRLGRRVVVPTPRLLAMLGAGPRGAVADEF